MRLLDGEIITIMKLIVNETRLHLVKYEWIYGVLFDPAFRVRVEEGVWPTLYQNDRATIADYEQRKTALAAATTTD